MVKCAVRSCKNETRKRTKLKSSITFHRGSFRSIHSIDKAISEANISWNGNWVTFIDSLIQLNTLKYTNSGITQPHNIGRLAINIKKHFTHTPVNRDPNNLVSAQLSRIYNRARSGGVLIENMKFRTVVQNNESDINMQTLKFVPRFSCNHFKVSTSLTILLQIAAENINKDSLNVLGLTAEYSTHQLFDGMKEVDSTGIPKIKLNYRQLFTNEATVGNMIEYEDVDVVLIQHLSKNNELRQILFSRLKPNSFIVNEEDAQTVHNSFSESYNVISVLKNTNTQHELLYWKPHPINITSTFTVRSSSDLPLLKNARANLPPQNDLLILSSYPAVTGLMKQVHKWRREDTHNRIYVIMVHDKSTQQHTFDEYPEIILANSIFDNGLWGGEYYLPFEEISFHKENVKLQCEVIGDLNSLKWQQTQNLIESGDLVKVHYMGINTGDTRRALGLSSKNDTDGFGMEFSGITTSGSRVMGLVSGGAARSALSARPELTWPVPPHWTLEDAATVPLAYFLAYYCLLIKSTMTLKSASKITTVLVHGGTGALGQAAISIALARGWRVFTTVADSSKKRFLMKLFPQINESYIGNSRDSSFGDMVLNATGGMGCDIVLCCLKGDLKNTSFNCCGSRSIMFDTDQILSNENYLLRMNYLTKERSYVAVDITSVLIHSKSQDVQILHSLVSEGIALGEVRPLSRVCFAAEEAARAFRLVAASRHRGRTLLRLNHERAAPRQSTSYEESCEIVISDSNSLGIQMAEKLISCGSRKLHLHFNALATPPLNYKQSVWKQKNIQVTVTSGNIDDTSDVNNFILHNAKTLGPVEGLHVIVENCSSESLIELLDLATVTTCPSLKRFVVLTKDIDCGYNTCVQRLKKGLPATLMDLSMLDTIQDADGSCWIHGATVAMERVVNTSSPISVAFPVKAPHQPLVQLLANLLDIKIDDKVTAETTLKELGASEEKLPVIGTFLKDVYHHTLNDEDIFHLTIERITEIEKMMKVTEFEETTGLGTFFSYVDPDELLATTEMVPMPTLTNHYNMRDDEFNVNESFLCIVPGLEGHHERFRALCERLKLAALVLQPGLDHLQETPAELAHRYSKVLLKKTGDQKNFYILGYETGVLVALELAAILEDHGGEGTVFCLGAGPDEVGATLERVLRPYGSSGALQAAVARHMCALMARSAGEHAERALGAASSWGARVDACVRALRGRVPHSAQYARALLEAAYGRIEAARRAAVVQEAPRALRSRLVLLRARTDAADSGACSLQRYSRQPLLVRDLVAPLAHAAADPRAPAIINSCLDPQLLRAFDDKNLCDTYLSNADAFMTASDS